MTMKTTTIVSLSQMKAFGLFILKYYSALPSQWKHWKLATMEDGFEAGPMEEIKAVVAEALAGDHVKDPRETKRKRKDKKLPGSKLDEAMQG